MKNTVNFKNQSAFTLIELMIVIAIIGILMAYAIPTYRQYTIKTLAQEGSTVAAGYKVAVGIGWTETGALTTLTNGAAGIGPASVVGNCVNNVAVAAGVITVTYACATGTSGSAHPIVDNSTMVWTPAPFPNATNPTSLQWSCVMSGTITPGEPTDPCPK